MVIIMKIIKTYLSLQTKKRIEVIDITNKVSKEILKSGITNGFGIVYIPHTTAAVTINEPDPALFEDIIKTYTKLVPIEGSYKHNEKYSGIPGEQNAHAHILSSLIKPAVVISIENGSLELGTWQAILFLEFDGPRNRKVYVKVMGD